MDYAWLDLLRVRQYYKNLLIFIPFFFGKSDLKLYIFGIIGFLILCTISSAGYVLNDLLDYKRDRVHDEKKHRPLAAGKISRKSAFISIIILFCLSVSSSYYFNFFFFLLVLGLFINSVGYSLIFKHIAIADLHFISFNYVIRALSGIVLSSLSFSPWLVLMIFVMALFLATAKRRSDLVILGNSSTKHKKVYLIYTEKFLDWMTIVLFSILFISYILYSFMAHGSQFMITIPFFSFITLRYMYLVSKGDIIARRTEYFFKDKQLVIAFLGWIFTSFLSIYIL